MPIALDPFQRISVGDLLLAPACLETLAETFRALLVNDALLEAPTGTSGIVTAPQRNPASPLSGPHAALVIYPFDAAGPRFVLGRSSSVANVIIRDVRISKGHAAIAVDGSHMWLTDLSSSNGTFVGSRCLAPGEGGRAPIAPGDRFALAVVNVDVLDRDRLRALIAELAT